MPHADPWPERLRPLLLPALLLLLELAAILALNGGLLSYTLDDAYIHLAMAEEIARSHYGVQPGQVAAASSSIAWPALLALFRGALWAPLLLNFILCLWCVDQSLTWLRGTWPALSARARAALALGVMLAGNLAGLVFLGLEHLLQAALALLLLRGLERFLREGRVSMSWQAALALAPLVRYELLALTLPALLLLALRGRRGRALGLLLLSLLPLAAFSLWLRGQGLDALPASILVKAEAGPHEGPLRLLARNLFHNLLDAQGLLLALAATACLAAWRDSRRAMHERGLALFILLAAGLHLLGGRMGWYARYEQYLWLPAALVLARLFAPRLERLWERRATTLAALAAFLLIHRLNVHALLTTPLAANNILVQQGELRRFAAEIWRGPVAANDIGYLNWRNEWPVLDLWGLSSAEARRWRAAGMDAAELDTLLRREGVAVALIYEPWFPHLPAGWRRLGELRLTRPCITPALPAVSFWCADPAAWERLRAAARTFAAGLPAGAVFVVDESGSRP